MPGSEKISCADRKGFSRGKRKPEEGLFCVPIRPGGSCFESVPGVFYAGPGETAGTHPGKKEKEGTALTETKTRIAVIGIIIEDRRQAEKVNALLHQYGSYVIGRMGLPYEKKQVNIISVVLDAPMDAISALSGKLGRLPGVSARAIYSKAVQDAERAQRPKGNPPAQGGQEG